jgi:hypothetical protein
MILHIFRCYDIIYYVFIICYFPICEWMSERRLYIHNLRGCWRFLGQVLSTLGAPYEVPLLKNLYRFVNRLKYYFSLHGIPEIYLDGGNRFSF